MAHPIRKAVTVHDERESARYAQGHVFVIDDDNAVRLAVTAILDHEGYAVSEFSSAEAFLDFEQRNEPLFPGPKCLLLDVKMPGSSGLDLQHRLTALETNLPIVFMSGGSGARGGEHLGPGHSVRGSCGVFAGAHRRDDARGRGCRCCASMHL